MSGASPGGALGDGSGVATRELGRRVRTIEAAAIAGVVYAVLTLAARAILYSIPDHDDPELVSWFSERGNQDLLLLALNMTSVATVAFLWFVAVIRRRIGSREDQLFPPCSSGPASS